MSLRVGGETKHKIIFFRTALVTNVGGHLEVDVIERHCVVLKKRVGGVAG